MNFSHLLRFFSIGVLTSCFLSGALADNLRITQAPAAWRNECAGCHVAYPPKLLPAAQWKDVMQQMGRHYGTDASLTAAEVAEITSFLMQHAGRHSASTKLGELPRVTQTAWFERKHRRVPASAWSHSQVRQKNNCAACHTQAQEGRFSDRDVIIPGTKEVAR